MTRAAIPPLLLTLLLAFAFVLPFQGTRHLWGTDEGRYSAVAAEMLDSGDWLVPHRHPEHVHLSKPPLTYWALAASMAAFGENEWALRLPSALAFVLTIGCVLSIGKRLVPERPLWPPLICASTAMVFLAANAISTDPLLCGFETLGMAGYVLAWRGESERIAKRGALILGLGFGLAFLTKGPPGLVALIPSLWFWWRNRGDFRANPFTWKTLAVWAPIALSWFIIVVALDPTRLGYFLGHETYGRIFTDAADRHPQWYGWIVAYGPVALIGALPWTFVLLWDLVRRWLGRDLGWYEWLAFFIALPILLIYAWFCRRRSEMQSVISGDTDRSASHFLLLWLLVPLAVFCFARSRLILYVLPLLVPFALWVALRTRHLAFTVGGKVLLASWLLLLIALKVGLPMVNSPQIVGKDSKLLSGAIRAQVKQPIHEVVFVDETALYGVRIYLGTPVLRVDYGESGDPAVDMSLAEALAQHRPQRLWLVHMHTADQFAGEVAHAGGHAQPVVSYGHYRGFLVDPAPGSATPSATTSHSTPTPMGHDTPVPPSPQ